MTDNLEANLFRGKIPTSTTLYVEVPVRDGVDGGRFLGVHVAWLDATSSATITLELTSYRHVASGVAGNAWEWIDSGLTFTGPAATAAGGLLINIENIRQHRARLKIVTAAITTLDIRDGTNP
jgi:hypothetical protein